MSLPSQVAELVNWPSEEQKAGNVVDSEVSRETLRATRSSVSWIITIIERTWLPDRPEETLGPSLILLEKAYPGLDTSHVEWEKSGYRIRVSQTTTVFYVSATPLEGTLSLGDLSAKRTAARELTSRLVNGLVRVKDDDGTEIADRGTMAILLSNSFDEATVEQFGDGIVGRPAHLVGDYGGMDMRRLNYWWRRAGWWTNGRTLGLFTLKYEGGPWEASYGSKWDGEWFKPRKRYQRDQRETSQRKQ